MIAVRQTFLQSNLTFVTFLCVMQISKLPPPRLAYLKLFARGSYNCKFLYIAIKLEPELDLNITEDSGHADTDWNSARYLTYSCNHD